MHAGKWLTAFVGIALAIALGGQASAQQTIKVAYTDPLSGPFAQVGDANLKQMQYIIDYINAKAVRSARSSSWCRSTTSRSPPMR